MRSDWWFAVGLVGLSIPAVGHAELVVTEIMYDPGSNESRWEWFEVHNTGAFAVDLDGYFIDRVGDRERIDGVPSILSAPAFGDGVVGNATVIPAGGVAILYNGDGLAYDPARFRAAWPGTTPGATLIGVSGWSANQLTNAPRPTTIAPSLPALTVGLWRDEAAYRSDAADFGTPTSPSRRVFRVDNAAVVFGYDDSSPWRSSNNRSSLLHAGGPALSWSSWTLANHPFGETSLSVETYFAEPVGANDYGSPGIPPPGKPSVGGLTVTELMYNAASTTSAKEWEWIEVYNAGPTIDFAATPHWLDDDDGDPLDGPNLTSGTVPAGGVAVLFNADAVSLEDMQAAWDRPGQPSPRLLAVEDWPGLNNGGDVVGFWADAYGYLADHEAGESLVRAVGGVVYDDSRPWPQGVDGEAIRLTNLGADPRDPGAWTRARGAQADPDAWLSATVFAPGDEIDSRAGDQGSPGYVWRQPLPPLPGDYNADGSVDAADYTVWRDAAAGVRPAPPTETVSVGVADAADHAVWRTSFGQSQVVAASVVPEPRAAAVALIAVAFTPWRRAFGR
ncbi:MAG: lamin tail domain-containing protein [Planctomycetota bacterium]